MGKRGPAPKGDYIDKSKVLSTKISADIRSALESAATDSGRTLSHEIEHRLRRSFDEEQKINEIFGGRQFYAIMRAVSATMDGIGNPVRGGTWVDDPYAFDQMMIAVNAVLAAFRPPGTPSLEPLPELTWEGMEDDPINRLAQSSLPLQGALKAEAILTAIANVGPALPVSPIPLKGLVNIVRHRTDPAPYIRDGLGKLADRIPKQGAIAKEAQRLAWEIIDTDIARDSSLPDVVRSKARKRLADTSTKSRSKESTRKGKTK